MSLCRFSVPLLLRPRKGINAARAQDPSSLIVRFVNERHLSDRYMPDLAGGHGTIVQFTGDVRTGSVNCIAETTKAIAISHNESRTQEKCLLREHNAFHFLQVLNLLLGCFETRSHPAARSAARSAVTKSSQASEARRSLMASHILTSAAID
jgi:hypothetical protein